MSNSRLVYSTDSGRVTAAHETPEAPEKGGDATLIISRQTKGRKGKGVTLIDGFQLPPAELKQLAKTASDSLDKANFPLVIQSINQLKANGAQLTVDQFMVVSEASVNVQSAMIEAAENGDKKAQQLLNLQSAGRRN